MIKSAIFTLLIFSTSLAWADSTSSFVLAVAESATVPPVSVVRPAEYVAIPVSIDIETPDPALRADGIEKALSIIDNKVSQVPGLVSKHGGISFSSRGSYSSKLFSSAEKGGTATAQVYILSPLNEGNSLIAATKKIYQAISTFAFSEETKMRIGDTRLGINNPEQARPELLSKINTFAVESRKLLGGAGSIEIYGLEEPVSVMQSNEKEVVLFINFKLSIQSNLPN